MDKKLPLILLLSILLPAAIVISLIVLAPLFTEKRPSLEENLSRADDFIARAYVAEAESAVAQAFSVSATPEDLLRVLKRAYILARMKNSFRDFKERSRQAFARFPAQPELCRAALYGSLRDGDLEGTLSLKHGWQAIPEIQALEAESLFKTDSLPSDSRLKAVPLFARYLTLSRDEDPERFFAAGRELGDSRFFLDGALLQLKSGKAKEAAATAGLLLLEPRFDEAAGLIAYEAGLFAAALERLRGAVAAEAPRPDLYIISGDCSLLLSQTDRAADFYQSALQQAETYSVVPYLNMAWIYRQIGADDKAFPLLQKAHALFPENHRVVLEFGKLSFRRGERDAARRQLDAYLLKNPDDFDARFLRLHFEEGELSTERLLIGLKDIYFQNPKSERAAEVLLAKLFAYQDLRAAREIVAHYREDGGMGKKSWLLEAAGLLEAGAGNLDAAAGLLKESLVLKDAWESRYNRSLIVLALGRLREAEEDLRMAFTFLDARDDKAAVRGKTLIHAQLAAVAWQQGRREEASLEIQKALKLDPASGEAYRVLRRLETSK